MATQFGHHARRCSERVYRSAEIDDTVRRHHELSCGSINISAMLYHSRLLINVIAIETARPRKDAIKIITSVRSAAAR